MEPDMLFLLNLYLKQGREATIPDPVKNCSYDPFKFNFKPFQGYQATSADLSKSRSYEFLSKPGSIKPAYERKEKKSPLLYDPETGRKKQSYDFLDELLDDYQ